MWGCLLKAEWSVDPSEFANLSRVDDPDRIEAVIDAVESLPPELKAVIDGLFWERLTAPGVMRALDITPAVFNRRLEQALARLADVLGRDPLGTLPPEG